MNDSPGPGRGHPGPAADLVEGRLRDGRQPRRTTPAENLAEALEIVPDERVLDVACGSGNGAIAAARRSLGQARSAPTSSRPCSSAAASGRRPSGWRSSSSRPTPRTCPSRTASFDVAMSIFGAMFAPDQERRRPPSCCAWSSPAAGSGWPTGPPTGAVGSDVQDDRQARRRRRRASTRRSLWGTEERLRELFGDGISDLRVERRSLAPAVPLGRPLPRVLPHLLRPDSRWPTNGSGPRASRR